MHRFCDGTFGSPPISDTNQNCVWQNTGLNCPLGNSFGLSVQGNKAVASSVVVLGFPICPMTIGWRISLLVIFSFYCERWMRSWSHVSKKFREIVTPFSTYRNSSLTIMRKMLVIWVRASLDYMRPDNVLRRASFTMRSESLFCGLPTQASTTGCLSPLEELPAYDGANATVASALPKRNAPPTFRLTAPTDHNKPTEPLSNEVSPRWHVVYPINVTRKLPILETKVNHNG